MARQQQTEPQGEDLPDISGPELSFCRLIVEKGLNNSDAYRRSFPDAGTDSSVWSASSRLRGNARIQRWINHLKLQAGKAAECTLIDHMNELERLKNAAQAAGNFGAAVQAEQLRGKVAGHHIERIKDETERLDDKSLIASIEAILGKDIAEMAAFKLGVPRESDEQPSVRIEESEERVYQ